MALDPCYTEEQIEKLADGRKWVSHRTIARLDIPHNDRLWLLTGLMSSSQQREFARRCALDVIDKWDVPVVVKKYLETGNDELRTAARYAAMSKAMSKAWSVARSAAMAAARYAARDATRTAARSAARAAASDAASAAASDAARYAASAAASAAASDAAWAAASKKYLGWCVEYLDK